MARAIDQKVAAIEKKQREQESEVAKVEKEMQEMCKFKQETEALTPCLKQSMLRNYQYLDFYKDLNEFIHREVAKDRSGCLLKIDNLMHKQHNLQSIDSDFVPEGLQKLIES